MNNPGSAQEVFDSWRQVLEGRPEIAANYGGSYKFIVNDRGCWLLECAGQGWQLRQTSADTEAKVTISLSEGALTEIASGECAPAESFLQGKAALAGDSEFAARLGLLLRELIEGGRRTYH